MPPDLATLRVMVGNLADWRLLRRTTTGPSVNIPVTTASNIDGSHVNTKLKQVGQPGRPLQKMNMEFLKKDDVALKYEDTGIDLPPMVLIHGCGCDHSSLAPQAEFFRNSHRVISVDLRGHGEATPRIKITQWLLLQTILCGFVQSLCYRGR
jgi:hypothetical protein